MYLTLIYPQIPVKTHKIFHVLDNRVFQNPFIHTLIVAAQQDQVGHLRQLFCHFLIEHLPAGGHADHIGLLLGRGQNILISIENRLGLHHHPRPAAIRVVVHPVPLVPGIVPDIAVGKLQKPLCLGTAQNTLI